VPLGREDEDRPDRVDDHGPDEDQQQARDETVVMIFPPTQVLELLA
jgi:hypothetical protein